MWSRTGPAASSAAPATPERTCSLYAAVSDDAVVRTDHVAAAEPSLERPRQARGSPGHAPCCTRPTPVVCAPQSPCLTDCAVRSASGRCCCPRARVTMPSLSVTLVPAPEVPLRQKFLRRQKFLLPARSFSPTRSSSQARSSCGRPEVFFPSKSSCSSEFSSPQQGLDPHPSTRARTDSRSTGKPGAPEVESAPSLCRGGYVVAIFEGD
jgi:hypothetical protein